MPTLLLPLSHGKVKTDMHSPLKKGLLVLHLIYSSQRPQRWAVNIAWIRFPRNDRIRQPLRLSCPPQRKLFVGAPHGNGDNTLPLNAEFSSVQRLHQWQKPTLTVTDGNRPGRRMCQGQVYVAFRVSWNFDPSIEFKPDRGFRYRVQVLYQHP